MKNMLPKSTFGKPQKPIQSAIPSLNFRSTLSVTGFVSIIQKRNIFLMFSKTLL